MDEMILEAKEEMSKKVEALRQTLVTIRTGRANPAMLSNLMIDYYGEATPINQVSSITVPEPRQLLIKPYDKSCLKGIVEAINKSDLGINPVNEGNQIRLTLPVLTEDRRKELTKQARKYGEEKKVDVRNIRRDYMDMLKEDKESPEDLVKKMQEDLQKVTDEAVKDIDAVVGEKEKEIMAI